MSEVEAQAPAPSGGDKRAMTEEVLGEILKLMGIRARVEVKELPSKDAEGDRPAVPASISVALHLEEEVPGIAAGKRSQIVDSMQFLANKIVNRGAEKRWINIGVGAHPEPKVPGQKQKPAPTPRTPEAPVAAAQGAPAARGEGRGEARAESRGEKKQRREKAPPGEAPPRRAAAHADDESRLEVADDAELQRIGKLLAEKSTHYGRIYGVVSMSAAERVNLARGADGVVGVTVKTEGEGRHRRVVFVPANAKPMPKKSALPDYDDEDELED